MRGLPREAMSDVAVLERLVAPAGKDVVDVGCDAASAGGGAVGTRRTRDRDRDLLSNSSHKRSGMPMAAGARGYGVLVDVLAPRVR